MRCSGSVEVPMVYPAPGGCGPATHRLSGLSTAPRTAISARTTRHGLPRGRPSHPMEGMCTPGGPLPSDHGTTPRGADRWTSGGGQNHSPNGSPVLLARYVPRHHPLRATMPVMFGTQSHHHQASRDSSHGTRRPTLAAGDPGSRRTITSLRPGLHVVIGDAGPLHEMGRAETIASSHRRLSHRQSYNTSSTGTDAPT